MECKPATEDQNQIKAQEEADQIECGQDPDIEDLTADEENVQPPGSADKQMRGGMEVVDSNLRFGDDGKF
jgi:hypothetical protein